MRAFTYIDPTPRTATAAKGAPLEGVPIGVKDLIDVRGMPTTASSRVLRGNVPDEDAPVVARLRAAGAVVVGKTNLDEFGYGVFSPPTRNPWDSQRIPGGSSGGSAAAVAAGMCMGALGTDTAGSIRIPSALCGVSGLKPRRVLDTTGVVPLAPSLDTCGPIARRPVDLVILWEAMTGPRSTPPRDSFRVGVFNIEEPDIDPDVARRYKSFVDSLGVNERCHVVLKQLPPLDRWQRPGGIVLAWEAAEVHRNRGWFPERSESYSTEVRAALEYGSRMDRGIVEAARSAMDGLRREFDGLMCDVDVLVMPTTPCVAPKRATVTEESRKHWIKRLTRFASHVNFCRLAAVTIPLWGAVDEPPWGVDAIASDEWTALDFAIATVPRGRGPASCSDSASL